MEETRPDRGARPLRDRRSVLVGAGALGAAVLGLGGYRAVSARAAVDPRTEISLWSQTVALDAAGHRHLVGAREDAMDPGQLRPGTRLLRAVPEDAPPAVRAAEYLAVADPWLETVPEPLRDLATSALWDLFVLSDGLPAPVAAWSESWRYIWPRDTAFCAMALARVGHTDRALTALTHLQDLQRTDGWFEARHRPDDGAVPDGRPAQFDGVGLTLWAVREVLGTLDAHSREQAVAALTPLIDRSLAVLLAETHAGDRLPPASPDYWEVAEKHVSLEIMAATLIGLRSGSAVTASRRGTDAAETFTLLLEGSFGENGYQRYRAGGGADSALALFDAAGVHGLVGQDRLRSLRQELARDGGGIAPGAAWREDGVSWTPSTSLLGLALARAGATDDAHEVLAWFSEHRTAAGSLPEKVLYDGRPAEVAPLAWTAANVLLTIDALR